MSDYERAQQENILSFGRMLEELLVTEKGKYVVICRSELVGTFATREAALGYGYERFGRDPFLVQPVAPLPDRIYDFHLACQV
jgi:hypothetical protein